MAIQWIDNAKVPNKWFTVADRWLDIVEVESNGFKHTKAVVRKNNREKMANRWLKSVKLTFRWINRMKLAVW